jgi:hypothetical protein
MNIPTNLPTRTISLWQPYAWLVANNHKPVENRPKRCHIRGQVLIHAGLHFNPDEWTRIADDIYALDPKIPLPNESRVDRGGIVGVMTIHGCVEKMDSPWFTGRFGWLVKDCQPLPFRPCKGSQGFFNVNYYTLPEAT